MKILVNASNLKRGGGLQVGDSVCRELYKYRQHSFVVVLPSSMNATFQAIEKYPNIKVFTYDLRRNWKTFLFGRDEYLDALVDTYSVESVLTFFGPSVWIPKCTHLCGFARAQIILPESPYYQQMDKISLFKTRIKYGVREWAFKRCSNNFYTENPFATKRLSKKWPDKKIFTVTNYYNQVFDQPSNWKEKKIKNFEGITILTVTALYAHKNLGIAADTARLLKQCYPDFRFRFILTISREEYRVNLDKVEENFVFVGKVDISECPSLYKQSDIVFQPTLLECFTASYPEAMRMERPIVTTDLEFAKVLCGNAAEYYTATDPKACAEAIYKVATNNVLRQRLVNNGNDQLKLFDNYIQRVEKLIRLQEIIN